ncbi:amino acid ABC transporter membrane protein (PAAT family) [Natranaerovirga pectinivora]|uniref:Amino acid ABC transporter membrane protein (PAAT family) n=1 Tax=Natranaerovirga pectinivora TaxID=682400 RepID=A0A4R3MPX1_9FIRM|nr:amino acid ABC transporter permease [Natranaerovirga pectinivora]TCT16834.1 amino acid ABC transporter membrane protein (PAAT family) [Natranaerovirga pectinivora]
MDRRFEFSVIFEDFSIFIPAAIETIKISFASIILGVLIGFIIALLKLSKYKIINIPASIYIGLIRGTPILVQLLILYYGLTNFIRLDPFPSAVIAFGVHNGAYIAEIFRGAILSIDHGQREAARSLGMTKDQAFKRVVFPQALKRAVPPLGNQFIIAIKDSSLASAIAIRELLMQARQLGSSTFNTLEYLIIAAIYYLIITLSLSFVVKKVEKRLAVSDRGRH